MRQLIAIFLILMISACSKSQHAPVTNDLTGSWKLQRSVGGIGGIHTYYGIGKNFVLRLQKDSSYDRKYNGMLQEAGSYHMSFVQYPNAIDTVLSFVHDGYSYRMYLSQRGTSFILVDEYMDGYTNYYDKVAD